MTDQHGPAVDREDRAEHPAIVIGSGPAGLATAAELAARGIRPTVLERGAAVGAAWRGRYDSLRFNTSRIHSALPGAAFDRSWGQFPTRDQYVGYLRDYAATRGVEVRTEVRVDRLDPCPGGWRLETSAGRLMARHVVVATGIFNDPALPAWAQRGEFPGRVLHSSEYVRPEPFSGEAVLVVGAGSTGMELARELAAHGAGPVWLSVRTPPHILYREVHGRPADLPVPLFLRLPPRLVDRLLVRMERRTVGDLAPLGLPLPEEGPIAQLTARGAGVAVVDPEVVDAIRSGSVRVVPAVHALDAHGALLRDGTRLLPDTVIAATGYTTGLEPLVGHLRVLDEQGMPTDGTGREVAPGLRFVGFVYRPGLTGYVGRLARRAASGIAARERAGRRARHDSTPAASRTPTSRARGASRG